MAAGEKTEKATPKKRQDSRKKGQVAKSADVNTALILLAVFLFLLFFGASFVQHLLTLFRYSFSEFMLMDVTEQSIQMMFVEMTVNAARAAVPIAIVAFLAAIATNYLQIGFLFSTEAVQFKLERLNPLQGAKKIFALRALVELVKSVLKISFVGGVAFGVLWLEKDKMFSLGQLSPGEAAVVLGHLLTEMGLAVAIVLIFVSIIDFVYQRFDYEKNLRMSKQDVKDENKNMEGDPKIKQKIKERQQQMAMRRMMQEVPEADVIITNPTHYAIALKYDGQNMDAPVVTAKGADFVAQKIKEIAKQNNIVTMENRPLARALYQQAEIGKAIPEDFFKAVAEILAYVYRLKNKV
ncbi:MAG TPA: flagellar biosynthesis protein FlhB [Bacillales bacterium]|nr:flagellar biosynthesis protein FlhB [Bacillales bacterium]